MPLVLFHPENCEEEEEETGSEGEESDSNSWENWIQTGILSKSKPLYSPSEIQPECYGNMKAVVFHEHLGYKSMWPAELELIRAILEREPPEGEDFRSALDERMSYWRWRD